jgi:hypothetical protein
MVWPITAKRGNSGCHVRGRGDGSQRTGGDCVFMLRRCTHPTLERIVFASVYAIRSTMTCVSTPSNAGWRDVRLRACSNTTPRCDTKRPPTHLGEVHGMPNKGLFEIPRNVGLDRSSRTLAGTIALLHATLVPIEPVKNLFDHQIVGRNVSCFEHHVTFIFRRRT